MTSNPLEGRLGLNVPYGWWPAASLLKGFEAGGFAWAQVPSPPGEILSSPRECLAHARAAAAALDTTGLEAAVHAPGGLRAGTRDADRAFEGLLAYAAEAGAGIVVYHARDLPDEPESEDLQLAETRSLSRLAARAEQFGTTIALENLAPFYPGPERLSHTPMVLRSLVHKLSSPAVGLCLDLGHAHIVSDLRHSDVGQLIEPVPRHRHDLPPARQPRRPPWRRRGAGARSAAARPPPATRSRNPAVARPRRAAQDPPGAADAGGPSSPSRHAGAAAFCGHRGAWRLAAGSSRGLG